MTIDDRLRSELRQRSEHIPVEGAGAAAVAHEAQRRLRRTRIVGAAAGAALLLGVTGTALVLRDDADPADQVATELAGDATTELDAPADVSESTGDDADPQPAVDADSGESADAGDGTADELATTETDPDPDLDAPTAEADGTEESDEAPATDDPAPAPGASAPLSVDMISHGSGVVALRTNGSLWYSADGASWSGAGSPGPTSPTMLASDGTTLVVAGTRSNGQSGWVSRSDAIGSWTEVDLPLPDDDGSSLTEFVVNITGLGIGPDGIIVTGEILVEVDIAAVVGDDVAQTDSWTLGDSTGDLSTVLVYDDSTGDIVAEYDLAELGVPQATLDLLNSPNHPAYVATGDTSLSMVDSDLPEGTILTDVVVDGGQIHAAGWSTDFSSRILWSSTDATSWEPVPVSVIPGSRHRPIGVVGNRTVIFSSQGPILTVQSRGNGGDWSEVRLDQEIGSTDSSYQLVDAAHGSSGIAALIVEEDGSGNQTLHLATSDNGRRWQVRVLEDVVGTTVESAASVAVSGGEALISYAGPSGTQVASASLS